MKRPDAEAGPVRAQQRERLARWLAEWDIEQTLLEAGEAPPQAARRRERLQVLPSGSLAAPTGAEPPVAAGQIRLLSPEMPAAALRPVHVAVLREDKGGSFLAAPFSRFAEPALPGELETGRTSPALRVLCLWNARAVSADILRRSWVVDALSERERHEALCVYKRETSGSPLPAEIAPRTGPPLIHPDDPRQVYRHRETLRMDRITGRYPSAGRPAAADLYVREDRDLPMAAEDRSDYGSPPGEPQDDPETPSPPDGGTWH